MLSMLLDDQPIAESVLEVQVLEALQQSGMYELVRQFRPPWYEGIRGIVDFAEPVGRTILEADGRRFRQVTQAHDDDRRRDRIAAANGYAVIRVGHRELEQRMRSVVDEITTVVEARRLASSTHAS